MRCLSQKFERKNLISPPGASAKVGAFLQSRHSTFHRAPSRKSRKQLIVAPPGKLWHRARRASALAFCSGLKPVASCALSLSSASVESGGVGCSDSPQLGGKAAPQEPPEQQEGCPKLNGGVRPDGPTRVRSRVLRGCPNGEAPIPLVTLLSQELRFV
eukprot:2937862-Prymnesium_polylepis.1